jgi:hypothetical protein
VQGVFEPRTETPLGTKGAPKSDGKETAPAGKAAATTKDGKPATPAPAAKAAPPLKLTPDPTLQK